MSSESENLKVEGTQFRRWVSAWCDGIIGADEFQHLQSALAADGEARQMFFIMMHIHARLQGQSMVRDHLTSLVPPPSIPLPMVNGVATTLPLAQPPTFLQFRRFKLWPRARHSLTWAAVLLIAALVWGLSRWIHPAGRPTINNPNIAASGDSKQDGELQPAPLDVAKVTDCSDDCQWYFDQGSQSRRGIAEGVRAGDTIRVTSGRVKLLFTSGTEVTLHAPGLFQVISDMRTRVLLGKVTARIAKGAEGFSVMTPRGTVIDLGTEFGLEVNERGATDLVVFKGAVNFDYVGQDTDTACRQRLQTGEGLHLDASGTPSRIVSITDQLYSESPSRTQHRLPLITEVSDNIQRERDAWNYYEIVQEGMREDAKAFADREEHEWNGVTTDGMPSYLLGGDYVKTFNNDKVKRDIEITVRLERAAKLYILFDNRIPAPEWLKRDFRPTGDEIGVDEGVYCVDGKWYTNHHPGKGPGVSIDHISDIWVRQVDGPCLVKLGPTESTTVDINMYGIVAVALDGESPPHDIKAAAAGKRIAVTAPADNASALSAATDQLIRQMTLDEKIGQMTQVDSKALADKSDIARYFLGSVLSGGSSDPPDNSLQSWTQLVAECKSMAQQTRLKIPLLYGIDAVHGHNNIEGAVIFPHNIGLGATRNPESVEKAARATAEEVAASGINWDFAPCIAVARNPRWGRTYESFGETPQLAELLGPAAIRGLQGDVKADGPRVLSCAKHFLGDGGTTSGEDQGNTQCDEATLRKLFLPGYVAAVRSGVGSIMVSFSSWNGQKMHRNKYLLTDVLKGELGFRGFLVSDWAGIDKLSPDYKTAIEKSINAGIDMAMVPNSPGQKNSYVDFINNLKELVLSGKVPQERIDDAVRRILFVKQQMGLFEPVAPARVSTFGSAEHRAVARQCVRQSIVLLKNENRALPLSKQVKHLVVVGQAADAMGIQCGGWTIDWQGKPDLTMPGGTTILEGIRNTLGPGSDMKFSPTGALEDLQTADAIIVVVGEQPYAEMKGDRKDLALASKDAALIASAKQSGKPVVTVLLSGRPLILGEALSDSDAFVAAWLPGTEGQGVADVLFGDYQPTGKLPFTWPRSMDQVPIHSDDSRDEKPLFPYGFGLSY